MKKIRGEWFDEIPSPPKVDYMEVLKFHFGERGLNIHPEKMTFLEVMLAHNLISKGKEVMEMIINVFLMESETKGVIDDSEETLREAYERMRNAEGSEIIYDYVKFCCLLDRNRCVPYGTPMSLLFAIISRLFSLDIILYKMNLTEKVIKNYHGESMFSNPLQVLQHDDDDFYLIFPKNNSAEEHFTPLAPPKKKKKCINLTTIPLNP